MKTQISSLKQIETVLNINLSSLLIKPFYLNPENSLKCYFGSRNVGYIKQ